LPEIGDLGVMSPLESRFGVMNPLAGDQPIWT